jgi:hypothetical protein
MDVRIRYCGACYTKKVIARKIALAISSLGIDVMLESGYHGQCDVFVDGVLLPHPPQGLEGYPDVVVDDVRKRLGMAAAPALEVTGGTGIGRRRAPRLDPCPAI